MGAGAVPDGLRDQLRGALRQSMRERQVPVTAALRSTLAAIENAEAVDVPDRGDAAASAESVHVAVSTTGLGSADVDRRVLTEDEVRRIVQAERDELLATAAQLATLREDSRAEELRRGAQALTYILSGR